MDTQRDIKVGKTSGSLTADLAEVYSDTVLECFSKLFPKLYLKKLACSANNSERDIFT